MGKATNGLGWVVEQHTRETGWAAVTKTFPSQAEAEAELPGWKAQAAPARVYEALDNNHQRTQ